jgi:hypothetical protein
MSRAFWRRSAVAPQLCCRANAGRHVPTRIWQVLPRGNSFPLRGERTYVVRDRYVESAVAANVLGRHAIVPAAGLDAAQRERSDHVVAPPEPALLHVLVPCNRLAALAMTDTTAHPSQRLGTEVAQGLALLGRDSPNERVDGTDFVVPESVVLRGSWLDTHPVVRTTNGREIRLAQR